MPTMHMHRITRAFIAIMALLLSVSAGGVGATSRAASVRGGAAQEAPGTLYTETNTPGHNQVVAYHRAADGSLSMLGTYDTGGAGTGVYEDSNTMLVLGSAAGQSSPVDLGGGADLLFVANAGSNDISVFKAQPQGRLTLVTRQPSGGDRPTSLTVRNGLLYVMDSAGGIFPGEGSCFAGKPTISGFRVAASGQLTPIPGSTRRLSAGPGSGCNQITFNPSGTVLLVSQFAANRIDTFTVGSDGIARGPITNVPVPSGPFGLNFDKQGRLLTTEEFQGLTGRGGVVSYRIGGDGHLQPIGGFVPNGETETCWIVPTPDGRYAYTSSFGPLPSQPAPMAARHGAISSYRLRNDGTLEVLNPRAGQIDFGAADITLAGGGRYLYALNAAEGTITGWRIGSDGSLTLMATVGGITASPFGPLSGGLAARDNR